MWVKNNWRFVASVAVIVGVFGFGYYKGYSHEHTKFQNHLNADATAMALAKAENERRIAQQQEIITTTEKEYKDAVAKLHDYYKSHPSVIRVCHKPNSSNAVPSKSKSTGGVSKAVNGAAEATTPSIEIDLLKAGEEIIQCQALIEFEKEQDRVK